jgi:transposase-like protein
MKTKQGVLALGLLAAISVTFSAFGATTAAAADPVLESADAAIASGDHRRLPHWIKNSIIACAARTMDERVAVVKAGLRQGYSLKEIGIRHGVRPEALENGILRCERHFLYRLVEAGKLTRVEAARIYDFIEDHITRIINFKYPPSDPVLRDAAGDETLVAG